MKKFSLIKRKDPNEESHKPKKKKKKLSKKMKILIAIVVVAAAIGGVKFWQIKQADKTQQTNTDAEVTKGDIQSTLTSTGTIEAANEYDVTSSVNGEVLTCSFDEGDTVNKGDVLYTIDSSDTENSIDQAALSLKKAKLSYDQTLDGYDDLKLTADESGTVTKMYVEAGDQVESGTTIADVQDSKTMTLSVPFNSDDAKKFWIGESGTVTIGGSLDTVACKVTDIDTVDTATSANQVVRYVEVSVTNPGGISTSTTGTVVINGEACTSSGTFAYNSSGTITADHSGKISSLKIKKGSTVTENQTIGSLDSSDMDEEAENSAISMQDSELSYQSAQDKLDDYTITAPITGTVITKNTKVGDNLDSSEGQTTLAVIYDMSYLKFDMSLDELDVNSVAVGQTVEISCDSLDSGDFEGVITKVSVAGTTENGVTSYPVTVEIDDPPDELLPGMNVDATIIVDEVDDVLRVPVDAVQRGDVVYVKDDEKTDSKETTSKESEDTSSNESKSTNSNSNIPDGYHEVKVVTGLSNDTYIEIKSGLSKGDKVYIPAATGNTSTTDETATTDQTASMGMMGGGSSGGGPSGGGPSGGPSGGGSSGGGMP